MTVLKSLLIAVLLTTLPWAAQAAPKASRAASKADINIMCDGTYALCIKAPCVPVLDVHGGVASVVCSCTLQTGWSMGPAACRDRRVIKHGSTSHMMSTYSNYYNNEEQNLTCNISGQQWANCYGAPCISDASDPNRAHCTCPVRSGEMVTLGGRCDAGNCGKMWSAARPKENTYANTYYYNFMKQNGYQTNPPAQACPVNKG